MAKSHRQKLRDATFDSAARANVRPAGIKPGDKQTKPAGNVKAAAMKSDTKATGSGASKGDPRPAKGGEFKGKPAAVARAKAMDERSDRAIARKTGTKYKG